MNVMEIIAPRGSIRLEAFPTLEEFRPSYHTDYFWWRLTEEEKLDKYFNKKKRHTSQQCQGIKAFMKQHRSKRRNGHGQQR